MKGVGYELVSNGSMYEHLVGIEVMCVECFSARLSVT